MKELFYLNKYFAHYRLWFVLGILFIAVSNWFGVEMPKIIGSAIDEIKLSLEDFQTSEAGSDEASELAADILKFGLIAIGLYLLFSLLKGLFLFFTRQTIIVMSRYIEYDLKNEIYTHYQKLDQAFYKRNSTGDLMNRISEDVSHVRMYLGPGVMYTINLVVLFVMTIVTMLQVNVELTLYVLAPLPIMSVMIYFVSRTMNKRSEQVQRQQSNLSTFVQEVFSGIRAIKAYSRERAFNDGFVKESADYRQKNMRLVKINALFLPTIMSLIGLSTIITIWVGGLKALDGQISVGDVAVFVIYVNMLTWPFASVGWVTSLIQRAAASQERINEFLKTEPAVVSPSNAVAPNNGDIEFNNVTFDYPGSGIRALTNVSFVISKGSRVAIVGKTGSGKSTIAGLLCRLYDPSEGQILLNNKPLAEYDLDQLRNMIGYVPQDVFLFSDTIGSNIAFGVNGEVPEEDIIQAAKDAVVYDNIMAFEHQFETMLGERGINLSGGQKQRVSIARALIRKPDILIFDDCMSAVDAETEEKILGNLLRIMKGRTSVMISHRISAVKDADMILVLDQGALAEHGTHEELLNMNGLYAEMYEKQRLETENVSE
jgi:ATP-binding cassette, subfamily B, multidrug efflux pump